MPESKAHKRYMKAYRKEQEAARRNGELIHRALSLLSAGVNGKEDYVRLDRVKVAASWIRSGRQLESYPSLQQLTLKEALIGIDIGCGHLPWPRRWTPKLLDLCTKGWVMPQFDRSASSKNRAEEVL